MRITNRKFVVKERYASGVFTSLRLVKLNKDYLPQLFEMMDEWSSTKEKIIPWSIRKCDYHDIETYIESLEVKEDDGKHVPDSTFFCLDVERNIFVGAVTFDINLNDELIIGSGHIGNGIRPSERGKGFGTEMISLTLKEL